MPKRRPSPRRRTGFADGRLEPIGDYAALREQVAHENKLLTDQVAAQRAIVKKNQYLLKEAQRINAANLKMAEEQKKLAAESAELEKQRETLKAAQKTAETTEAASKQ